MKWPLRHIIFFALSPLLLWSCGFQTQKRLNRFRSYARTDKIPYGTYVAHQQLSAVFPQADVRINTTSPEQIVVPEADSNQVSNEVFLSISPVVDASDQEVSALVNMAYNGQQVFLAAGEFSDSLLRQLNCKVFHDRDFDDSCSWSVWVPSLAHSRTFTYPGEQMNAYFSDIDSNTTQVLGWNELHQPDFIRVNFPHRGAIFLHLAPLAFTNFFLLHKQNSAYYEYALSYLPVTTRSIRWDDYFRHRPRSNFSALKYILSQRSLRWAFWLVMAMLFVLYLFESKRKQRAQERITPPANASVDFVKTVGRLYYQQKNNQDLAVKMIAAFLEQIHAYYHIQTVELNDGFSQKLAYRTGQPLENVQSLVYSIHYARLNPALRDDELLDLHRRLTVFKKMIK